MGFFENQGSVLGEGNGPVLVVSSDERATPWSCLEGSRGPCEIVRAWTNLEDMRKEYFPRGCGKGWDDLSSLCPCAHSAFASWPRLWLSVAVEVSTWRPSWGISQACCSSCQVIRRRSTGDFPAKRHQTRGACQGSGSPASLQGCVLQSAPDGDLEEGGDEFSGSADTEKSETFVLPEGLQRKDIWKKCPKAVISPTSHRLPAPCRQSNVGPLWMWEVPQMLQILDGSSCRSWSWMAEQSCCSPATGVCSACPRQK
ncbi:uncharacterized protein isoform X3 [Macaca fascicularis]|uniref:uncharacterized protein isoform X3 n=1 Tax=Macaca fascicularis TaxID=9541 RepID=UPI003D155598